VLFVHSLNRHLEGPEELFACHRTSEVKETSKAATKELSKYRDDPKPYRTACLIIEPNILAYAIVSCGLMDEGAKPQRRPLISRYRSMAAGRVSPARSSSKTTNLVAFHHLEFGSAYYSVKRTRSIKLTEKWFPGIW
jgi:hypothetical protein